MRVRATVRRNDVERVRQLLTTLLLDRLPATIGQIVRRLADPVVNAVTRALAEATDVAKVDYTSIRFHAERAGTPGNQGGTASCAAGDGVAPGRYQGSSTVDFDWGGSSFHQRWHLDVGVGADGQLDGSLTVDGRATGFASGTSRMVYSLLGTPDKPLLRASRAESNGKAIAVDDISFQFLPMTGGCADLVWDFDLTRWPPLQGVTGEDTRVTIKARKVS